MINILRAFQKYAVLHKIVKLRQRTVFNRQGRLRLRYIACGLALVPAMGFTIAQTQSLRSVSWIGGASHKEAGLQIAATQAPEMIAPAGGETVLASAEMAAPAVTEPDPGYVEVEVGKGDTIGGVLESAGIAKDESFQVVEALKEHYNPKNIQVGQKIRLDYEPVPDQAPKFTKISMKLSPFKELAVFKQGQVQGADKFVSRLEEKELKQRSYAGTATIENSLYGAANKAGIPSSVIAEVIRIYSWNTDFQRDIHRGDKIQVLYDVMETEDGVFARTDKLLYANLTINGRNVPVYRYEMADGRIDYFQPNGTSIRKTLMKTPIDGARISSGFGVRHHPVLGYTKMHKGVDFAAARGTPIYAAGAGTVEYAGRFTSYGNYVRIRHNSNLKTAYAHMNGFGRGIRVGTKVSQGDVIGYVGTTGRSTGPHLHYEVIAGGRQVNPNSMNLPTGEELAGKELKNFKDKMSGLQQQYVSLSGDMRVAGDSSEPSKIVR